MTKREENNELPDLNLVEKASIQAGEEDINKNDVLPLIHSTNNSPTNRDISFKNHHDKLYISNSFFNSKPEEKDVSQFKINTINSRIHILIIILHFSIP